MVENESFWEGGSLSFIYLFIYFFYIDDLRFYFILFCLYIYLFIYLFIFIYFYLFFLLIGRKPPGHALTSGAHTPNV